MAKSETGVSSLDELPTIGAAKPKRVKRKKRKKKKVKKRKKPETLARIVEVPAEPVDETEEAETPDYLAQARQPQAFDEESLQWLRDGALGELSPEALKKLRSLLQNNRNRLDVFRHLTAQHKIRRTAKLNEVIDTIDERLFTPERIAGATTAELAGLRKIAGDQVNTNLDFIGDVANEAQPKVPDDAVPAKDLSGEDVTELAKMPAAKRDAVRALIGELAEAIRKGAQEDDD